MPADRFVSYGQNREDVVLWRALGSLPEGCYVDVGASHPVGDSVTKAFYDRGWSGVNIEPTPVDAQRLREARPRDHNVEVAITSADVRSVRLHMFAGTGLSTLDDAIAGRHAGSGVPTEDIEVAASSLDDVLDGCGLAGRDIHFLKIDVEGSEADVLASLDLRRWRPWVMVIEATEPNTTRPTHDAWEPRVLAAGYRFCLFDGLSRFYVAEEHAATLGAALSYPACVLDSFVTAYDAALEEQLARAADAVRNGERAAAQREDQLREMRAALEGAWSGNARLQSEVDQMKASLVWRMTRPLRAIFRSTQHTHD